MVGSIAALGSWDTDDAVALSASKYTAANPVWEVTLQLAAGQVVDYKFLKVEEGGGVTWEGGANGVLTVPVSCATTFAVAGTWQN